MCDVFLSSDYNELDSFETSMYGGGLPRRNSENSLASLSSQPVNLSSSSRPVDMPTLESSYYGSDTSLNLSGR